MNDRRMTSSQPQLRVSRRAFAATILLGVLPARPAWAHGEQLLVNAGVAFLLIPLWLSIVRRQIETLPEEIRKQTWSATLFAAVFGFAWALLGSNLVSWNAFVGPPLSFGGLSLTALPCAIALFRNGRIVPGLLVLGIPVLLGVLVSSPGSLE